MVFQWRHVSKHSIVVYELNYLNLPHLLPCSVILNTPEVWLGCTLPVFKKWTAVECLCVCGQQCCSWCKPCSVGTPPKVVLSLSPVSFCRDANTERNRWDEVTLQVHISQIRKDGEKLAQEPCTGRVTKHLTEQKDLCQQLIECVKHICFRCMSKLYWHDHS